MNPVVIFFVPVDATQHNLEAALREHSAQMQVGEITPQANTACVDITDNDQSPLWTWFV